MQWNLDQSRHEGRLRRLGLAALLAGAAMPAAHAADALNGKTLYLNGPTGGGTSCSACHGPTPAANVNGILRAADQPSVISSAISANKGGMGAIFSGAFTATQLADLAAFIGNPTVTAGAVASLAPATLTFTGTTVGQSAAPLTATLSNTGNAALQIDTLTLSGANSADFTRSGGTCAAASSVAVGANCTLQLTFKPGAAGTRTAALTIAHNGTGATSTLTLSGSGTAVPQATLATSATSVNFGALLIGTASSARTVTISNSGQAPLSFTSIKASGAQSGFITVGGTCATATPVAAGASCTLSLTALASTAGNFAASVDLVSNGGNASIGLSGSGASATPALSATPAALSFGQQTIGAAAATQQVSIANTGNVALNFSAIGISGAGLSVGAGDTCRPSLAVGASCTVPVLFAPAAEGAVSGTLTVSSNAAPLTVTVSGTGTKAAVAAPTLSDSSAVAFADTALGKKSATHTTTLNNPSAVAFKISTLTLGGANAGDFTLGGTCAANATIAPAGSCTLDSVFAPTVAGARSGQVMVVTDGGVQLTLGLSGNGVTVAAPPALTVAAQSVDFGSADTKRITLSNTGTAAVTLSSATFSGPFARAADSSGCAAMPLTLQPGASCDLVVAYTAGSGAASGSVVIASDGAASTTIALAGQAAAVSAPAAQNTGGGGCSAIAGGNDPMLALLVLLSLGVLGWRRVTAKEQA